jgi:uncharacterized FlaG/YvyC family protein
MAGNTVASIQGLGGGVAAVSAGPPTTAEERALNRSVAAAVQTVNEAQYLGTGKAVTFAVDHTTRLPIVRVVDTSTNHIIEQWPPEYIIQLAADAKKLTRDSG